jgi:hypothetical protein
MRYVAGHEMLVWIQLLKRDSAGKSNVLVWAENNMLVNQHSYESTNNVGALARTNSATITQLNRSPGLECGDTEEQELEKPVERKE